MLATGKKMVNFFLSTGVIFFFSVPVVLASSGVNKSVNSTKKVSSNKSGGSNSFNDWWNDLKAAPFLSSENIFRGLRVLSLIFAILFINVILIGAFKYITTSADDKVAKSRQEIAFGLVGTLLTFCLYFWASAVLIKMKVAL